MEIYVIIVASWTALNALTSFILASAERTIERTPAQLMWAGVISLIVAATGFTLLVAR